MDLMNQGTIIVSCTRESVREENLQWGLCLSCTVCFHTALAAIHLPTIFPGALALYDSKSAGFTIRSVMMSPDTMGISTCSMHSRCLTFNSTIGLVPSPFSLYGVRVQPLPPPGRRTWRRCCNHTQCSLMSPKDKWPRRRTSPGPSAPRTRRRSVCRSVWE